MFEIFGLALLIPIGVLAGIVMLERRQGGSVHQ